MIYSIGRYPVHLIEFLYRGDATRLTIRPTLPQDLELQRAFFRALSDQSRYSRFMTRLSDLPVSLATRFENIDYRRHVALLASAFDAAGRETMIAEARYVVDEHDPRACEFAVAVADEWQRSGIATAMLACLEREAARSGLKRMIALTFSTNMAMLRLAERAGYAIGPSPDDATAARLEKILAGSAHPHSPGRLAA